MKTHLSAIALACLALGALRCGTTPAGTASVSPPADAGSGGGGSPPGSDGGSVGLDGGGLDGGTGTGGVDGGGVGTGGADAGAGGTSDGGTSDGGTATGGADGGTASTECDGLTANPNAVSFAITAPTNSCGLSALSDASGNLALGPTASGVVSRDWASYDSQGHALGAFKSDGAITPRAAGFFAPVFGPSRPFWYLYTSAPDGTGTRTPFGSDNCSAILGRASAGGVLILSGCGYSGGGTGNAYWFDDAGNQLWVTPGLGAYPRFGAIAGDRNGNALIAIASDSVTGMARGDLAGRWVKPDGTLAGDWFVIAAGSPAQATLQSLIEGGIAVMQNETWVAVLPSLGSPQPVPAWLAARPNQDFRIVRGRKAYAFTSRITAPDPHGSSGGPLVEVVTPSGKSCGTFDTKGYAATVGADGSVIANTDSCTRSVWPALLGVH